MSKLEQLIEELCPNGVEYVDLKLVCKINKGVQFNKANMNNTGRFPVINGGINPSGYIEQYNQDGNTITISQGGASAGYVNWLLGKFWAGAHCYVIKPAKSVNNRFLYHLLKMNENKLQECQYGAGIPALSKATLENLLVPLPPIPVQEEIVRILDNFTELTAELTAELTDRKKQYEYYRDSILEYNDYPCKQLGELCKFVRGPFGGALKKECFQDNGIAVYEQQHAIYGKFEFRYFVSEEKFDELKRFEIYPNDLIMSCSGTMGKIAIIPSNAPRGIINQALLKLTANDNVDVKYLKYCFESSIAKQMNDNARGGAIKNVASVDVLKKIEVKLPSLSEQKRIVDILDRFDTLCNDISRGLPAEIDERQKQYEYYRDKLLTFNNINAEV